MNPATTPEQRHVVAPEDRVPLRQKIVYGLGTTNDVWGNWLYPSLAWPVFNIFLLVDPKLVSTALMVNRLADAVCDPLFGWWSDNARTRWGRRRPFILVGSVLAGIGLPLLFAVPQGWSGQAYFWYMVVSTGLMHMAVSTFNMPYQSLGAELTPDYHERTSVYAWRTMVQRLPDLALFGAAAFVTASWFNVPGTGRPDLLRGAQIYTAILGAIMILVGILLFVVVKERYYAKVVERKQAPVGIMATLGGTLVCQPFRAQLAMGLSYGMGTSMVSALGYYLTVYHVCGGDVATGSKWSGAMGIANLVGGLIGVPIAAGIARRWGKRHAMLVVQMAAIAAFVCCWWLYDPALPALQLAASGSISLVASSFWMLMGSIGADVIDADELETGKRREGAFTACSSWITKLGFALGAGVSGFVLSATGFDAAREGAQSADSILAMRVLFCAIPVAGLLVAMAALSRFGLSQRRVGEIRAALEARRGRV